MIPNLDSFFDTEHNRNLLNPKDEVYRCILCGKYIDTCDVADTEDGEPVCKKCFNESEPVTCDMWREYDDESGMYEYCKIAKRECGCGASFSHCEHKELLQKHYSKTVPF